MQILTTDPAEIAAFRAGEIEGTEYVDGEIYIDQTSLLRWMARPQNVDAETAHVAQ